MTVSAKAHDLAPPAPSDSQAQDDSQAQNEPAPKKASAQILQHELQEAHDALERGSAQLFLSGTAAGLEISFSLFLMAKVETLTRGQLPMPVVELLVANMYSFGYIVVILGRSELFTEQTSLAIMPVLNGQASLGRLARVWGLIYSGNILGAVVAAALIAWYGPALGEFSRGTLGEMAKQVASYPAHLTVMSGILTGWLMGLLSWLVAAARDTISQIFIIWMITTVIGLGHLHHAIMGSVEVLGGVFASREVTLADFGHFLLWTTLGNAIGGPVFVALLKFTQAGPQQS